MPPIFHACRGVLGSRAAKLFCAAVLVTLAGGCSVVPEGASARLDKDEAFQKEVAKDPFPSAALGQMRVSK